MKKKQEKYTGPKKVLIIGSSSGYGLASRISLAFGASADTIGVAFEKGVEGKRVGSAGWWNTIAVSEEIRKEGLISKNFQGQVQQSTPRNKLLLELGVHATLAQQVLQQCRSSKASSICHGCEA